MQLATHCSRRRSLFRNESLSLVENRWFLLSDYCTFSDRGGRSHSGRPEPAEAFSHAHSGIGSDTSASISRVLESGSAFSALVKWLHMQVRIGKRKAKKC